MMGYGWGGMLGFGSLWMILGVLFWIGVVVLVVWAVMRLFPSGPRSGQEGSMEILRRRHAGGEITREQYDDMRQTLAKQRSGGE